jgi:hypothetical protein
MPCPSIGRSPAAATYTSSWSLNEHDALSWVEAPEPHLGRDAYMADVHYTPPDGSVVNICLDLPVFVKRLAARLERGMAIVLDHTASPPRDSLLTYYRHRAW